MDCWKHQTVPHSEDSKSDLTKAIAHLVNFYANNQGIAAVQCMDGRSKTGVVLTALSRQLQSVYGTRNQFTLSSALEALREQRPRLIDCPDHYEFAGILSRAYALSDHSITNLKPKPHPATALPRV